MIEYAVYKIAVDESKHGRSIKKQDYAHTKYGKVVLDTNLVRRLLETLERKFLSERLSYFKHGMKWKDGLSMCQEITIAKIHVQKLAEFCTERGIVQIPNAKV
ncbi:MAG: hypothetical protein ACREBU_06040 [Nitrososphaera sp.]